MHLRFNFDACPVHEPEMYQNLSAQFCHNSLAKVNTQLSIYTSVNNEVKINVNMDMKATLEHFETVGAL